MSLPTRQHNEQQREFLRQATILRKNLLTWDATLHSARGEDWPSMLGRLNAAYHQATSNLDYRIDDASEHFVYVPKKCTVNAADVAFFLSTRLDNGGMKTKQQHGSSTTTSSSSLASGKGGGEVGNVGMDIDGIGDNSTVDGHCSYGGEEAASRLQRYEGKVADLASEFEDSMVRF
jgi:hypothetical protein